MIYYVSVHIYMPNLFLKLNNLFADDLDIANVKKYLKTKVFPSGCNTASLQRKFITKYHNFKLQNDVLIYEPLNLIVVPQLEREALLQKLYDDESIGVGKGIILFYKYVCSKYINITRSDIIEFLKRQSYYQMTHQNNFIINKPIVASYPNEMWCCDLIDMQRFSNIRDNKKYNYILTVIDVFSGKVWLEKLKKKTVENVIDAMERIFVVAGVDPKNVLSDNGGEFAMTEYLKERGIKLRRTRAYSAQSNGICEQANAQVRKKLRELFIRNNSLVWITHLQTVADNKNNSWNSIIKASPNELWAATNTKVPARKRVLPESFNKQDITQLATANRVRQVNWKV